jgi:hypothetical protein
MPGSAYWQRMGSTFVIYAFVNGASTRDGRGVLRQMLQINLPGTAIFFKWAEPGVIATTIAICVRHGLDNMKLLLPTFTASARFAGATVRTVPTNVVLRSYRTVASSGIGFRVEAPENTPE